MNNNTNIYLFYAECIIDVNKLVSKLSSKNLISSIVIEPFFKNEVQVVLTTSLTKEELVKVINTIPDSQVIVRTLVDNRDYITKLFDGRYSFLLSNHVN